MTTAKTCPHDKSNHVHLSGTKVRERNFVTVNNYQKEFSRPEVADVLIKGLRQN